MYLHHNKYILVKLRCCW